MFVRLLISEDGAESSVLFTCELLVVRDAGLNTMRSNGPAGFAPTSAGLDPRRVASLCAYEVAKTVHHPL